MNAPEQDLTGACAYWRAAYGLPVEDHEHEDSDEPCELCPKCLQVIREMAEEGAASSRKHVLTLLDSPVEAWDFDVLAQAIRDAQDAARHVAELGDGRVTTPDEQNLPPRRRDSNRGY